MKYLYLTLITFAILISSCARQKDYIAEYDYNYRANFKKYKTFDFIEDLDIVADSTITPQFIKRVISSRMSSQGFRQNSEKPDLLVTYKLFYSEVKYRGYDQPSFQYWLQKQGVKVEEEEDEEEKDSLKNTDVDEQYDKVKYMENQGMLVIYVIDNKKGHTIWQGYTNAHFDYLSPSLKLDITRATSFVMDQFRLVTQEYASK